MWKTSNTETVAAPAAAVWKKWTEVERWPEQDASLSSASISGPFQVGSIINLKPKGSPKVKVVLVQVKPNDMFASEGRLPLAKLRFVHQLQTAAAGTSFTQSVTMSGPLSGLFAAMMGKKIEQYLKARMAKMTQLFTEPA